MTSNLNIIFKNATIVDGSGAPGQLGSVRVDRGVIQEISLGTSDINPGNAQVVDCNGLTLSPGFIDVHTHDDALMLSNQPHHNHPAGVHPKLSQGVTTVITGNCGVSLAPLVRSDPPAPLDILGSDQYRFNSFAAYLQALEDYGPVCNVGSLIGHTTLRVASGIELQQAATPQAAQWMAEQVRSALNSGALGLSTGVYYPPAKATSTAELIQVCQPLKEFGAPVTMHLRDEADGLETAMQEAFDVGQQAGCAVVLSHHKVIGAHNAGKSVASLKKITDAALQQAICLDCYPYDASSTMLLAERVTQSRDILITWSKGDPNAAGRSLKELAKERGLDPTALARQLMPAGAVYFAMDEADVQRILQHPLTMIGSDGLAHDPAPHPRLWGSFARVLGRYSRELKLFPLETAVYKMTGLSAHRFGLDRPSSQAPARGQIQIGWAADLVLFDAQTITDRATFAEPNQMSLGVHRVYVNGQLAALEGQTIAAHAGHVLRNARYHSARSI